MTLNDLVDAMFPEAEGDKRARWWNATRVLAQKGAIVPLRDVSGSGKHRRYDPVCVPIAKALLILKDIYRVHTDVLVEIGRFLWEERDMIEGCPDPVVVMGEFFDHTTQELELSYRLMSSAQPESVFYPHPEDPDKSHAIHCIGVALDMGAYLAAKEGAKP